MKDTIKFYRAIYAHMKKHGLGFCWTSTGQFIPLEQCEKFLKIHDPSFVVEESK